MSFYVTLPSNIKNDIIKNNTTSNYTTIFKSAIELDSKYEVALTEISIPTNFKIDIGFISINNPFYNNNEEINSLRNETLICPLSVLNNNNIDGFISDLNLSIENFIKYHEYMVEHLIEPGTNFTSNFTSVIINNDLFNKINNKYDTFKTKIIKFVRNQEKIQISTSNKVELFGSIAIQLFNQDYISIEKDTLCSNLLPNKFSFSNYAAIYSDIIEEQYIGDTYAPILKIINIQSEQGDHLNIFENPHYLPVSKSRLTSINIRVTHLDGNNIKFQNPFSFVIVKLHFRKK